MKFTTYNSHDGLLGEDPFPLCSRYLRNVGGFHVAVAFASCDPEERFTEEFDLFLDDGNIIARMLNCSEDAEPP